MLQFIHESAAVRVCFGAGAITDLADEADRLGLHRLLLVSSRSRRALAQQAADILGTRAVGIHAEAIMHVPVDTVTTARTAAERLGCDGYVAIGGGSTVGLAKAIALESGLPIIAIPTTYAGSEVTDILGQTEAGRKTTIRDPRVLPEVVLYDPDLTLGLPIAMTVTSGLNAMAHAVEGLYAQDRNPVASLMAVEGLRALRDALPAI
ncbi:MAG TPA: iron-containing alcohol dehydrogenase, partial [Roseiflexaceae bacterium]|nr:iron-containing alcohol dehydrogenase [Roseiflexaceae bacterium]